MTRRYVFAGNWKMNKTVADAVTLARALREGIDRTPTPHEVVVMPPFTALAAVSEALKGSAITVGGQNMHWEREGAFTGEISPVMLRDLGCTYVILGHSERRHIFGESDDAVGRKARAAFDFGLTPIVCVGETLAERESNRTLEVVERQTERGLRDLKPEEVARMVVAYEPVWAIGTGRVATPDQAEEVQSALRKLISKSHGEDPSEALRILYGGSVTAANIAGIMVQANVDGVLVGGASLKPDAFLPIVNYKPA
ncbi:MAG TPA: triose-phosphate isomerase [Vicinamibacteria bacterium]|jgi:triosephosphate isomerase|nr:triose-phosphate isomerase [Vicinamibacteria bacterium]